MSQASDYLETAVLNAIRGNAALSAITPYVALFSSDPTDTGSGTEVTTTIRVAGRVAATFGAPSGGSMTNSADVDFGTAAGGATVTHFAIYDAAAAGNLICYGAVTGAPITVGAGTAVKFTTGQLTVTVA